MLPPLSAEGYTVLDVLQRFPIGHLASPPRPITSGLIHGTWLVDADEGRFILQRLHHKLATPEILADYRVVTEHLAAHGVPTPRLIGPGVVVDDEGAWWRLCSYVAGETRATIGALRDAEQGARALGRFHHVMSTLEYDFQSAHPLHDTPAHLAGLQAAAADPAHAEARAVVADEIDRVCDALPTLMLPAELPLRVVHGDPKISNVVFRGTRAVGLIDLDTCNRHSALVDLGDAVRSWCRDGGEDEAQRFRLDRFEAILKGYAAAGPPLRAADGAHLADAGPLVALELAARFLRDALEDAYFGWDAARYPSRRAHNRARARGMLYLAADMARHRPQMAELVARHFPSPAAD